MPWNISKSLVNNGKPNRSRKHKNVHYAKNMIEIFTIPPIKRLVTTAKMFFKKS